MRETLVAIGVAVAWVLTMILIAAAGSMIGDVVMLYLEERYNILDKFKLAQAS